MTGRLHRFEHVMGTAVVFDVRSGATEAGLAAAIASLHWVDRTFSTFLPDSEISRIGRGDLSVDDAHPGVREVLTVCDELRAATRGWFDHTPKGPDTPALDPSGYVKGWATQRAAEILEDAGATDFMINAGGDIVAAGSAEHGVPWRVGIRDPRNGGRLIAEVDLTDISVATSGTYERGLHIWSRDGNRASGLGSATVLGPDLGIADALATAIFAAGGEDIDWFDAFTDYTVLLADDRTKTAAG